MNGRPLPPPAGAARLLAEADRCVKCGLCLPACPTYRLLGLEGESPRGRIALIQGLVQGALRRSAPLEAHLDNCLACRACEAACPSGVRYGDLIDGVREHLARPRSLGRRGLLWALSRPLLAGTALAVARHLRLHRLAGLLPRRASRLLRLAAPGAATATGPPDALAVPAGPCRGRVGLFLGCVARAADAPVHAAANTLLRALGYTVVIPDDQGCCGAMHRHAGDLGTAGALAGAHAHAWQDAGVAAVVFTATGCGAALRDHHRWLGEAAPPAPGAVDLVSFLADADWSGLTLARREDRAVVHTPCSARDAGLATGTVLGLLGRIPGLEVQLLDPALGCCGAAGTYVLHHAANADAIRERTLDAIAATGAAVVLTTNVGCAMHLRAGIAERGLPVQVMHPAELLARAAVRESALDSR